MEGDTHTPAARFPSPPTPVKPPVYASLLMVGVASTAFFTGTAPALTSHGEFGRLRAAAHWSTSPQLEPISTVTSNPEVAIASVDLAEAVQQLHDQTGLTWDQLAKLFGVSRRAVHLWATGGRMNAAHATRLSELARVVADLPGSSPSERRAALFTPRDNGHSLYDDLRAGVSRGEPITGSPYAPEHLIG